MDQEEVKGHMAVLGITMDNTPADRERFDALIRLIAGFEDYQEPRPSFDELYEEVEEWLVG